MKNSPPGKISIKKCKNTNQFFLRTSPEDKSGEYISKKNVKLIKSFLQKNYDDKVLKEIEKEINALMKFTDSFGKSDNAMKMVYENYDDEVRSFIQPVMLTDKEFVDNWMAMPYEKKPILDTSVSFVTENGETVRSKSELTIANALKRAGVPYKYECPFMLKGGIIIHPDFTTLNVRMRKMILWEHRGAMDDKEYAKSSVLRGKDYSRNNIVLGRDLVITEETYRNPLGTDEIEFVIKNFLL